MTKRLPLIHLILALMALLPGFAHAQEEVCEVAYEQIFELKEAQLGSYNIWDAVYGQMDKDERFKSGVALDSGSLLAAGERFSYEDGPVELLLVEIDRRGRVTWEKTHAIKDLRSVIKILPAKDGYLVAANKSTKDKQSIWLGLFDAKGDLKSEQSIRSDKGSLRLHDIIIARDVAAGYVLAASHEDKGPNRKIHSVIYRLNRQGQVVTRNAYAPGPENRILGLSHVGKEDYLAVGYVYGEDGRRAGWIMRLAADGSIIWQRQYPRGGGAEFVAARDMLGKFIAVAGNARPLGRGGAQAGWLMVIGADGDIGWQRYYNGRHDYAARDLSTSSEGMISLILQGSVPGGKPKAASSGEDQIQDYVRLLTINPRGGVFISDEYFNGKGAQAFQMVTGPVGERIIIGGSEMVYQVEKQIMGPQPRPPEGQVAAEKNVEEHVTPEGWVAAAAAAEPYQDPCIQPYNFLP